MILTPLGYLRAVDVHVVEKNPVRKVLKTRGEHDAQALPGDSGGPAFVFLPEGTFLAGVDSTGDFRGGNHYTAVPMYLNWIKVNIALLGSQGASGGPLKLGWNSHDLRRSLREMTESFVIVATNQAAESGRCRLSVQVSRGVPGTLNSYRLLTEGGEEEVLFDLDGRGHHRSVFVDPRASLNQQSRLTEMRLRWSCNGSPNKVERVRPE